MTRPRYRKYQLVFKDGAKEIIALLEKSVPRDYDTMGEAFRKRRAILEIFPELNVRVLSRQVKFRPVVRDVTR